MVKCHKDIILNFMKVLLEIPLNVSIKMKIKPVSVYKKMLEYYFHSALARRISLLTIYKILTLRHVLCVA